MSILANYYRLSPSEREKVMHDQTVWDEFRTRVQTAQSKALQDALAKVNVDGLTREEAYVLCSVAVDLRISEIVDAPNWVVSAFLPLDLFRDG